MSKVVENGYLLDCQFTVVRLGQLTGGRDKRGCLAVPRKPHVRFSFFVRRLQLSFTRYKMFEGKIAFANESQVAVDEPQRSKASLPRHWAKSALSAGPRTAQSRWMKAFDEDLI